MPLRQGGSINRTAELQTCKVIIKCTRLISYALKYAYAYTQLLRREATVGHIQQSHSCHIQELQEVTQLLHGLAIGGSEGGKYICV